MFSLAYNNHLEHSVSTSLFTDARNAAGAGGWWGDDHRERDLGSRLWTLRRGKQLTSTLGDVQDECDRALQWMLDAGLASALAVSCSWQRQGVLGIEIEITKPDQVPVVYSLSWESV